MQNIRLLRKCAPACASCPRERSRFGSSANSAAASREFVQQVPEVEEMFLAGRALIAHARVQFRDELREVHRPNAGGLRAIPRTLIFA